MVVPVVVVDIVVAVVIAIPSVVSATLDLAVAAHQGCLILLPTLSSAVIVLSLARIIVTTSFRRRLTGGT